MAQTKKLEDQIIKKIKRYRRLLASSSHLKRDQFIDMLHEVLKNSLVHLVEASLVGRGSKTGAWRDLLEKSYYLLNSCGEGFIARQTLEGDDGIVVGWQSNPELEADLAEMMNGDPNNPDA